MSRRSGATAFDLLLIIMTTELYISIRDYLRRLIRGTEWEGHVYAVGGCCRDELMGLPIKDVDMAVNLPSGGIRFAMWLYHNGYTLREPVTYPNYGTAMLRLRDFPEDEIELVQTRKEKYTDHSRRNPETVLGTLLEDCIRRDLTINALYYDISRSRFVDLTGRGVSDIREHIIRTPADPDMTYDDDPLRILRCIRFASRYGWKIDAYTFSGMCRNVDRLSIITRERVRAEFDRMLVCAHPVMAMEMLRSTGAMRYVVQELCETFDMEQNRYHSGTVWQHTLSVLENAPQDLTLRMAALLHDIGKIRTRTVSAEGDVHFLGHEEASADMARDILRRLKYSNDFIGEVMFLVSHHMDLKHYGDDAASLKAKKLRKIQYLCGTEELFDRLLDLVDADNRAHAEGFRMERQAGIIRERTRRMMEEGSAMFGYRLPLTGNDVMRIKGLQPGPQVKECMEYLQKLALVNPLRPVEEFEKHLKGYKLK